MRRWMFAVASLAVLVALPEQPLLAKTPPPRVETTAWESYDGLVKTSGGIGKATEVLPSQCIFGPISYLDGLNGSDFELTIDDDDGNLIVKGAYLQDANGKIAFACDTQPVQDQLEDGLTISSIVLKAKAKSNKGLITLTLSLTIKMWENYEGRIVKSTLKYKGTAIPSMLPPPPVEVCTDGIDNDGNALTDCGDPACTNELSCQPEVCNDAVDNNGNGLTDCADPACTNELSCQPEICNDALDNNGNGLTDCEDPACAADTLCTEPSMRLISGNNQTARVGQALNPFAVALQNAHGDVYPGFTVDWVITKGAGTISATATTTDAAGHSDVTLTLGAVVGPIEVTASADGFAGSPVTFTAMCAGLAFVTQAGGLQHEHAYGIAGLSDGGFIVTGNFYSTSVFGPGEMGQTTLASAGDADVFIACYHADGTLAWAKSAGGTSRDYSVRVTTFSDGRSVITGYFQGTATFGVEEPNQTSLTANGYGDLFVAQYSSDGALVWAKHAGGLDASAMAVGRGVSSRSDGTCVVAGNFTGTVTFGAGEPRQVALTAEGWDDMFVASYNPNGTLAWAKRTGGGGLATCGYSIATFADGGCAVTGDFTGATTFGAGEPGETVIGFPPGGDFVGAFIARYNVDGTLAWAKAGLGNGTTRGLTKGSDIVVLSDGSVVATGIFQHGITFGGTTVLEAPNEVGTFIVRYLDNGTFTWARGVVTSGFSTPSIRGAGLTVVRNGRIVVTGEFRGSAIFGAGEAGETVLTTPPSGNYYMFIAGYQPSDGRLLWAKNASEPGYSSGRSIASLGDGSFVVAGYFNDSATFGLAELGEMTITSGGLYDVFVAKYFPY